MPAQPIQQPVLNLDSSIPKKQLESIRDNFSAICFAAGHLFLGGDEGTAIDRVTETSPGQFGGHRRFDLAPVLQLPAGSEIDIEGLDFDAGYLWVIGSHSLKRKKPEDDKTDSMNRDRIASVKAEPNRNMLARIALNAAAEPVAQDGTLRSARLAPAVWGDQLFEAIVSDPLLGRFRDIPSKDNGVDIEGLAVRGDRVFAGLRGPVLRGWAVILEFALEESGSALQIKGGMKKHLLQLGGLGVRELAIHGKDLYILAGPTMELDGPVRLYRWEDALDAAGEAMVWKKKLKRVLEVPFGTGDSEERDHAEGIAIVAQTQPPARLMVCYDSPASGRLVKDHPEQVMLDVFGLDK